MIDGLSENILRKFALLGVFGIVLSFFPAFALAQTTSTSTASIAISMSSMPPQTVMAGSPNVTVGRLIFDASQSSGDVKIPAIVMQYADNVAIDPQDCRLYDGVSPTPLTGSTMDPFGAGGKTFIFATPLVITAYTVKTIVLNCDIPSSATTGSFRWSLLAPSGRAAFSAMIQSGYSITPTVASSTSFGPLISVKSGGGKISISTDSSSPPYAIAAGGSTGVTIGVFKFRASSSMNLNSIGLTLRGGTYKGTAASLDIVNTFIYNGATLVGKATFVGTAITATSTLQFPMKLPKDIDVLLTVKADLADVGVAQPGVEGDLIKIGIANYEATDILSGTTVRGSASTSVAGVRLLNTFPVLAMEALPTTGVMDGRLLRFNVSSNSAGYLGMYRLRFSLAITQASLSNLRLYAYTDATYSSPISGQGIGGQIGATVASPGSRVTFTISSPTSPIEIPPGQTYHFELRGTTTGIVPGSSIVATLLGDSSFDGMKAATNISGNFIWSPNATTTVVESANDWTNSYGVVGLPPSGFSQMRVAKEQNSVSNLGAVLEAVKSFFIWIIPSL